MSSTLQQHRACIEFVEIKSNHSGENLANIVAMGSGIKIEVCGGKSNSEYYCIDTDKTRLYITIGTLVKRPRDT